MSLLVTLAGCSAPPEREADTSPPVERANATPVAAPRHLSYAEWRQKRDTVTAFTLAFRDPEAPTPRDVVGWITDPAHVAVFAAAIDESHEGFHPHTILRLRGHRQLAVVFEDGTGGWIDVPHIDHDDNGYLAFIDPTPGDADDPQYGYLELSPGLRRVLDDVYGWDRLYDLEAKRVGGGVIIGPRAAAQQREGR